MSILKAPYNFEKLLKNPFFWSIIILTISASVRLFFLDIIEYRFDQAFFFLNVDSFYKDPFLIADSGTSSKGFYNFPLALYLMVALSVFGRDPLILAFMIALVNTLAAVAFYLVTRRFYGNLIAVFSGLILASSPVMVQHSRMITNLDLLFPFLVPAFFLFNQLIFKTKSFWDFNRSSFALALTLVLLVQIHPAAMYLLVPLIIYLLILKKLRIKSALVGCLIGLIPTIPFFIAHGINICDSCSEAGFFVNEKKFDPSIFFRPYQLINGSYTSEVLGDYLPEFLEGNSLLKFTSFFAIFSSVSAIIGIIYIFAKERKYLFLPYFLFTVPALYFFTLTTGFIHYSVIISPFVLLLYGLSFYYLIKIVTQKIIRILGVLIFVILISTNIYWIFSFYQYLRSSGGNEYYGRTYSKGLSGYSNPVDYSFAVFKYATELFDSPVLRKHLINLYIHSNRVE